MGVQASTSLATFTILGLWLLLPAGCTTESGFREGSVYYCQESTAAGTPCGVNRVCNREHDCVNAVGGAYRPCGAGGACDPGLLCDNNWCVPAGDGGPPDGGMPRDGGPPMGVMRDNLYLFMGMSLDWGGGKSAADGGITIGRATGPALPAGTMSDNQYKIKMGLSFIE